MSADYLDDRPGMMRVHVASERARLACGIYTQSNLRAWAKSHGCPSGDSTKGDLAWRMAQHGLIAADGALRDGFPGGAS